MFPRVPIPVVPNDERIGSVFNELFQIIYNTESSESDTVIWDFEGCKYFHPFFIATLAIYRNRSEKTILLQNINQGLNTYLKLIKFEDMLSVTESADIRSELHEYLTRSYIPLCRFVMNRPNVDRVQSILQKVIERQVNISPVIRTPLSYMMGELVGNINEHAVSEYGYVYSQYLPSEKMINICIADAGITIYGSYMSRGKFINQIGRSEAAALRMANEGYSTKDRPESESRGFGISTTKNMLVNGLGGSFFMLSGCAFHRYDSQGSVYIDLPRDLNWAGTIVLMKIPVVPPAKFCYSDYINF